MNSEHTLGAACRDTRNRLDAYLDGEMPEAGRLAIDAHLASCTGCAEERNLRLGLRRRVREAVGQTVLPGELERRVRDAIRARQTAVARPWYGSLYRVAAGIALLMLLGLGGQRIKLGMDQDRLIGGLSAQLEHVFRAGFADHLHCALFRESSHPVVQGLIERTLVEPLGPEYEELRRVVAQRPSDGLEIWMAHRCEYRNREFVHVALRGEGKLLSVILTRKEEGESFAGSERIGASGEVALHQSTVDQFQLAGFESAGQLVFVISNLSEAANGETAKALGGPIDRFLKSGSA